MKIWIIIMMFFAMIGTVQAVYIDFNISEEIDIPRIDFNLTDILYADAFCYLNGTCLSSGGGSSAGCVLNNSPDSWLILGTLKVNSTLNVTDSVFINRSLSIGTPISSNALNVVGNANISDDLEVTDDATVGDELYVKDRVGIGVTPPAPTATTLDVVGRVRISSTTTSLASKFMYLRSLNYNNSINDVLYFFGSSDITRSTVRYGGGSSAYMSVTDSLFYAGDNTSHLLGNIKMSLNSTHVVVNDTLIIDDNYKLGIRTDFPSEALEVNGNANISGNITGNMFYGEMWNKSDSGFAIISFPAVDTYVQIPNISGDGLLLGITLANSNFTIKNNGVYEVSAIASISAGGNSEYGMKVFVNNTGKDNCYSHNHVSVGNTAVFPINCLLRLNINDDVSIRIDDHSNPPNDATIYSANVNIKYRGS